MLQSASKTSCYILGFLFFLNLLAWIAVFQVSQAGLLVVNFFDVGQGDSIFIISPERHQILIDGGPDNTVLSKVGQEMPFWDRTIDLLVLTHPDDDHLSGLIEVLKRYKVGHILWTGALKDTNQFNEWLELLEKQDAEITISQAGQRISFAGAKIDILFPFESLAGQTIKNTNNTSIVGRLVFGQTKFLLTGDIYQKIEKELLTAKTDLAADVLKIGHHGSKTSSSEEFIAEVNPEIAIISVGVDNKFSHPNSEVLAILENFGIRVLRTDINSDIKIISDGQVLDVQNSK